MPLALFYKKSVTKIQKIDFHFPGRRDDGEHVRHRHVCFYAFNTYEARTVGENAEMPRAPCFFLPRFAARRNDAAARGSWLDNQWDVGERARMLTRGLAFFIRKIQMGQCGSWGLKMKRSKCLRRIRVIVIFFLLLFRFNTKVGH